MDVIGAMQQAHAALATCRRGEAQRISDTIAKNGIVGLLGEAEVGKSQTMRQALGVLNIRAATVYLDFEAVASDGHIGWQIARQIARASTSGIDLSILSAGALVPARLERTRIVLTEFLGVDGVEESLREWPSGDYSLLTAFEALERFAMTRDVLIWADHIEAPRVTPRHPVDVGRFLWGLRELHQRQRNVRIVVSGREGIRDIVTGSKAAFHQQGQWLTLDAPPASMWRDIAQRLKVVVRIVQELAVLTGGHPQTMLVALTTAAMRGDDLPRYGAEQLLAEVVAHDDGVAARAMQHARSLHRLGGQVLAQVARGQKPYGLAQRGATSTQEISKVLARLRLAGLLRHTDKWEVVNPVVAIRARGPVAEPDRIEDWEDIDY
ncbi:MAG: hypothetical protein ACRDK4_03350 [Solirubrobacteraceae bacterium]